eukprot:3895339-Pleurochrysis_carterae.AAC.2
MLSAREGGAVSVARDDALGEFILLGVLELVAMLCHEGANLSVEGLVHHDLLELKHDRLERVGVASGGVTASACG